MEENNEKMAMTSQGLKILVLGLVVMVSGYILMMGGGSADPEVFNYDMFDFRRMVAAPVVIILGIVLLWIVGLKKGTPDKELYYKKMLPILFVCIGYFLLVTKVAPYQVDRYVMPIYPLVYMMVIGLTCMIAEKVLPKKLVLALCTTTEKGSRAKS